MSDKLKPCGFCGATGDGSLKGALLFSCETDQSKPHVLCTDCFARGPYGSTVDEAVKLWNERHCETLTGNLAIERAALIADEEAEREIFEDKRGFCKATARQIASRIRSLSERTDNG